MYLGCKRWSTESQRVLPWSGGWMDWDLQETKEYEWLEDLVEEIKADNERRQQARELAKGFYGNVGPAE